MLSVLDHDIRERLARRAEQLGSSFPIEARQFATPEIADVIATKRIVGYYDCLTYQYTWTQRILTERFGASVCDSFNRCLLIKLLIEFDPTPYLPSDPPTWLYESYIDRAHFIAEHVLNAPDGEYQQNSESLVKDIRVLSGVSFPKGHQVVDWQSYLPNTFYRYRGLKENLRALHFVCMRAHGMGPFLRSHIDVRFKELRRRTPSEVGRRKTAEILECCPHILGTVGNSWMSDPALEWVSPQLWARNEVGRKMRSFLRRDGQTQLDIERATTSSKRRRQLYEEGKYHPCSYTSITLRENYITYLREVRLQDAPSQT